ncbi:hypothetical protein HPB51_020451 [Rhipicephalus microplus]|uniref:Uncharacterized protein n=1 Tax=Rhipicephalus microplus TaxID=6941 RepID=A0A9J6EQ96_RHIMP|nr:hypothetical protein HPB51_020451 [Rhipicephalus microplus]
MPTSAKIAVAQALPITQPTCFFRMVWAPFYKPTPAKLKQATCGEPDLLAPKEVDGLVHVVSWKATHDDDLVEPAAKFCTCVIAVKCLRTALTTAGEAAERGSPARMAALVSCLRDAFLLSDVPEEARLTLLELVELRASGWKLSLVQQLFYVSLNGAAGD